MILTAWQTCFDIQLCNPVFPVFTYNCTFMFTDKCVQQIFYRNIPPDIYFRTFVCFYGNICINICQGTQEETLWVYDIVETS